MISKARATDPHLICFLFISGSQAVAGFGSSNWLTVRSADRSVHLVHHCINDFNRGPPKNVLEKVQLSVFEM